MGERRLAASELLKEIGAQARLTVYLSFVPGAGKTYRLVSDARQLEQSGARVALGWVETKGRADLERMCEGLPRIPPRVVQVGTSTFKEFDFAAAIAFKPEVIVLDELAHTNLPGSVHAKRWQDALALRAAGISVLGAMNIAHLETVAPTAEALIGFPIKEIVPLSFLKSADQVVGIDIAREELEARLYSGAIIRKEDIDRAVQGPFRPQTLRSLREVMLRTIDDLTVPALPAARISRALALLLTGINAEPFLQHVAAFADAFNLELAVIAAPRFDSEGIARIAQSAGAHLTTMSGFNFEKPKLSDLAASFVALPNGHMAAELLRGPVDREVLVIGKIAETASHDGAHDFGQHPYARTAGDRLRIGYGRLTVYLGAAAGCGKTYAMLEQAHQLKAEGIDVVAAFVETHGREDTAKKQNGLEAMPRLELYSGGVRYSEFDLEALLKRRPQVALVDELAHTNAPGSKFPKRYEDVLSILRSGISVLTTLNVQHLEGLNDVVRRLTGITVRETMPDGILTVADDIVLIDASAQTLRERLRAGKIYPRDRIEAALSSFFRTENLNALRELALREALRVRAATRVPHVVREIVLGVAARERDMMLVQRAARLAKRLNADFTVVHIARSHQAMQTKELQTLREATRTSGGQWMIQIDAAAARAFARFGAERAGATLVVEGVRTKTRWLGPKSFAQQVLDCRANELLVLSPIV